MMRMGIGKGEGRRRIDICSDGYSSPKRAKGVTSAERGKDGLVDDLVLLAQLRYYDHCREEDRGGYD